MLQAPAAQAAALHVEGPWLRLLIPSRPAAGYFVLHNDGDDAETLVSAESPACAELMLHRSTHDGGQERMEMVQNVPVPAHGKVSFAPGGYHLMCMMPGAAVRRGNHVPVTFHFADGAALEVMFVVKGPNGQ
ncbi:MAG: copper chaperone PCu(A)C [Alphaproteobacteria bacterium]|nr:copper chaperone PCu(A)C [Alphaproteobacteria bacterium]